MNVIVIVETFVAFILAITLHEAAHAGMALLLGDASAVRRGRLSLVPSRQMTATGTLVAVFLSVSAFSGLGWGRAMEVDAQRMRVGPNTGTILTALAGPMLNFALGIAVASGLALAPNAASLAAHWPSCAYTHGLALQQCLAAASPAYVVRLEQFGIIFAITNIVIALVNLIPLHPLDGYHILFALLPSHTAIRYRNFMPYMELILLVLFLALPLLLWALGANGFNPGGWFVHWAAGIVNSITGGAYGFYPLL
jgi:Zn-dependent protease